MPKAWDGLLAEYDRQDKIKLLDITKMEYWVAFGEKAFATTEIEAWERTMDHDPRPKPWGGIENNVVYFTFKDRRINFRGNTEKEEAPLGFHMNVYSGNASFRKVCFDAAKRYFDGKLEIVSVHPNDFFLAWKIDFGIQTLEKVIKLVSNFGNNVLPKVKIE